MATKFKVNYELKGDSNIPVTRTDCIKHGSSMLDAVISSKADNTYVSTLSSRLETAESDISIQTARIDNIANLPDGSTSGDAELADIRIGADGITYDDAGTSVRSQISDVKNEISKRDNAFTLLNNTYELSNLTFPVNQTYTLNGQKSGQYFGGFNCTDYISCTGWKKIEFNSNYFNNGSITMSPVIFFDDNDDTADANIVKVVNESDMSYHSSEDGIRTCKGIVNVPDNATKVRFHNFIGNETTLPQSCSIIVTSASNTEKIIERLDDVEKNLSCLETNVKLNNLSFPINQTYTLNGQKSGQYFGGFNCTDYISCKGWMQVKFDCSYYNNGTLTMSPVIFFDDKDDTTDANIVKVVNESDMSYHSNENGLRKCRGIVDVPANATKVRFFNFIGNDTTPATTSEIIVIKDKTEVFGYKNITSSLSFINNTSIDFNGNTVSFDGWKLTDKIKLNGAEKISYNLQYYNNGTGTTISPMIFYYGNNGEYLLRATNETDFQWHTTASFGVRVCQGIIDVPKGATYVRFQNFTGHETTAPYEDYYVMMSEMGFAKYGKEYIVVAQDGTGDFSTIREALASVQIGGCVNILLKEGEYEEVNYIHSMYESFNIRGVSRDNCVIINKTGKYKNSPLAVCGNFNISNVTFKMINAHSDEWEPTYDYSNVRDTFPGYAIHIDGVSYNQNKNGYGLLENCVFYSECFPAVGMGVHANQKVEFKNCHMIRNAPSLYQKDDWRGAFLGHNNSGANQELILINNILESNYGDSLHIRADLDGNADFKLTAINNTTYSAEKGMNSTYYQKGSSTLNPISHGNTSNNINI